MASVITFLIEGGDAHGVGGQLVLSPDVLTYGPFRRLYEHDQTSDKREALADLKWVRFMGEEEGAFAKKDATEKLIAVNYECYLVGAPTLEAERESLRASAYRFFVQCEETEEGQTLDMLNARIHVIRQVIKATEKNPADLKDDKKLNAYMESSATQTTALLNLVNQKNRVFEAIEKRGGRKRVRNVGGAITSANESGEFSKDKIEARRKARAQNS